LITIVVVALIVVGAVAISAVAAGTRVALAAIDALHDERYWPDDPDDGDGPGPDSPVGSLDQEWATLNRQTGAP
jgi:hypothetical protein